MLRNYNKLSQLDQEDYEPLDPEEELSVLEAVDAAERFIRRNTRQAEPIPKGRLV